jgi:large subunit ribosomal protein L3
MFESPIRCGSVESQFAFGVERLGKEIKFSDVFQTGATVDVGAITKGKGWQGVIQRMGVKRKQHKSRKTVREVGSLGPISPQNVMYTVPRAGQMGFHQRVEYSKRIMIIGNTEEGAVGPPGGFKHFGDVKGDYIIVKGSVPGTYRRMIKIRSPIRNIPAKVLKPNILEVVA